MGLDGVGCGVENGTVAAVVIEAAKGRHLVPRREGGVPKVLKGSARFGDPLAVDGTEAAVHAGVVYESH
jgi:hypothetical protein